MKKQIDEQIGQKFAITAAMLMTRVFSTPLTPNQRRCMFAAGPASTGASVAPPSSASKFDVVGTWLHSRSGVERPGGGIHRGVARRRGKVVNRLQLLGRRARRPVLSPDQ